MSVITPEHLADLVGEPETMCQLLHCVGNRRPATRMIRIDHECQAAPVGAVFAADKQCLKHAKASGLICFFCGEAVSLLDVVRI